MSSPENDACVADISGFLARVTLAVQQPGDWVGTFPGYAAPAKLMAVFTGDTDFRAVVDDLSARIAEGGPAPIAYRFNPIIGGNFIVDPTVARSEEPVRAIFEAFFADDEARSHFMSSGVPSLQTRTKPAAVVAVKPFVFLPPAPAADARS
jgi:hypothetical protein